MSNALDLPPISTELLADVESAALRLGVTRAMMNEAAARAAAALCRKLLDNELEGSTAVGIIGTGVKASVALHTLRLLHGFGLDVTAILAGDESTMKPDTFAAARLLEGLRVRMLQARSPVARNALADADLVVDGLVGIGLEGEPREPHATLVRTANEVRAVALSIECPTGLDPDDGKPQKPTLKARATLALGLPVKGVFGSLAWQFTGELWLCDIGYPLAAFDENGLEGDGLFLQNELVRLR
jgi:NAD(P)H-hydrate epimerase